MSALKRVASDEKSGTSFRQQGRATRKTSATRRHPSFLFDHLVGEREQFVGNREAECLGGLEVDSAMPGCEYRADAIHGRNNSESNTRNDQAVFDCAHGGECRLVE